VEKNGTIKSTTVKTYVETELYKKAGYKTADGFEEQTSWTATIKGAKYTVKLFAKADGKANHENKYEFPPPVDSALFFGNCILVNVVDDIAHDLSKSEWDQIYEFLYGGFEDIGDDDSDTEYSESDDDEFIPRTKEGYIKDDFVVDDDASEEEESEDESDDDDSSEKIVAKKSKPVATKKKVAIKPTKNVVISTTPPVLENAYLDCTNELDFEDYE